MFSHFSGMSELSSPHRDLAAAAVRARLSSSPSTRIAIQPRCLRHSRTRTQAQSDATRQIGIKILSAGGVMYSMWPCGTAAVPGKPSISIFMNNCVRMGGGRGGGECHPSLITLRSAESGCWSCWGLQVACL